MEYKKLTDTSIENIHGAFVGAFSDYEVDISTSVEKLKKTLNRRGVNLDISIGAFEEGTLVGFILNGLRVIDGKKIAYDAGTGVIPSFRRRGITTKMLEEVIKILKLNRVDRYILEVIKTNTSAFEFYKKEGFRIKRELPCYEIDKADYNPIKVYETSHLAGLDIKDLTRFWDVKPSWQNSIDSVNQISKEFIYSVVYENEKIIGYGIIDKKTGDIPQIAVDKEHRNKGVGTSILTDLIENTEEDLISAINIDGSSKSANEFFIKLGFTNMIEQYEMSLDI